MLLAGLGGLWAAVTLPLTATAFGSAQWVWVFDYSVYVEARQWAGNPYVVFGALASLSFLTRSLSLSQRHSLVGRDGDSGPSRSIGHGFKSRPHYRIPDWGAFRPISGPHACDDGSRHRRTFGGTC